ncbi:MAG TPA: hypothetical protein VG032_11940 [Acidimicrobiales bacterium]|nr:hypothetical protein [Acidimicrobiales bacterium]
MADQRPVEPCNNSGVMSKCPTCRALSSIRRTTPRRVVGRSARLGAMSKVVARSMTASAAACLRS